jgi:predicted naringenin-chalcone synthase
MLTALYERTRVKKRHTVFSNAISNGSTAFQAFYPSRVKGKSSGPSTSLRMNHYMKEAPALALEASRSALMNSNISPEDIDHLVTVSCTGFQAPGLDIQLMKSLGLASTTTRTHVGFMGCHGAFNALRVAQGIASENPNRNVLICSVELCSIHFAYGWSPDRVVANALFADGAAAAVIGTAKHGKNSWRLKASGSKLFPESEDMMTWNVGDHGFVMSLSPKVPGLIQKSLKPWLEKWLDQEGCKLSDVASWAVHPGGPRILDSVESALGLERTQTQVSRDILTNHGNMSSATILFIIKTLIEHNAPRPCLALGFGPGLVAEGLLLT